MLEVQFYTRNQGGVRFLAYLHSPWHNTAQHTHSHTGYRQHKAGRGFAALSERVNHSLGPFPTPVTVCPVCLSGMLPAYSKCNFSHSSVFLLICVSFTNYSFSWQLSFTIPSNIFFNCCLFTSASPWLTPLHRNSLYYCLFTYYYFFFPHSSDNLILLFLP